MRLAEKYRPRTLSEVVGQPCVRRLEKYAKNPFNTCWIFTGPPGVGKSAAALALAAELGAVDQMHGLKIISTAQLTKEVAEDAVRSMALRSLFGKWNVLLLEELERISPQCQVYLKMALASENLPSPAIVIATSNDTRLIDPALLQRFGVPMRFESNAMFAQASQGRIGWIWAQETDGAPLPARWRNWGFEDGAMGGQFSMRVALDHMQQALLDLDDNHEQGAAA